MTLVSQCVCVFLRHKTEVTNHWLPSFSNHKSINNLNSWLHVSCLQLLLISAIHCGNMTHTQENLKLLHI